MTRERNSQKIFRKKQKNRGGVEGTFTWFESPEKVFFKKKIKT